MIIDPFFILAPPRSFTSVVCAMIGQHPQIYGLPETHLFGVDTMSEWWGSCAQATFLMSHGLLRSVAQIILGEQTETSVRRAEGWLRRRSHCTTGMILELLAERVYPRMLVDKSPNVVYSIDSMQRIARLFSQSRFLHLVRHPRGYSASVLTFLEERAGEGPLPSTHWLMHLAKFPDSSIQENDLSPIAPCLDPQHSWYWLNTNICQFLETVPEGQKLWVRGEDVLREPDSMLRQIAGWLGLRTDEAAIEEMKHPERSPFAKLWST